MTDEQARAMTPTEMAARQRAHADLARAKAEAVPSARFIDAEFVAVISDPETYGRLYRAHDGTWFFVEEWDEKSVCAIANSPHYGEASSAIQEVLAREKLV